MTATTTVAWGRRIPSSADEDLFYRLYCSTRDDEMALWAAPDDQKDAFLRMQFNAQRAHFSRRFADAEHQVITVDDRFAGRTLVERSRGEIRLVDLALLPEFRNAGLGENLVRELIEESRSTGKPVRLHVQKLSRAVRFCLRMGFRQIADDQNHSTFEWDPAAAGAA